MTDDHIKKARKMVAQAKARAKEKKGGFAPFDYKETGIDDAAVARLMVLSGEQNACGRRTTAEAFEIGARLAEASRIILADAGEDARRAKEKLLSRWLKAECRITYRHAQSFIAVTEHLGAFRDRIVAQGLAPTALFKIAHASRDSIETVLEAHAVNPNLTVRAISAILDTGNGGADGNGASDRSPAQRGGLKSLRQLGQDKARRNLEAFSARLLGILAAVLDALEPVTRGKRVEKGKLEATLVKPARLATRELTELTRRVTVDDDWTGSPIGVRHEEIPEGGWGNLLAVLEAVGRLDHGRREGDLAAWLLEEVVQALCWALGPATPKALVTRLQATTAEIVRRKAGAKRGAAPRIPADNDDGMASDIAVPA